MIVTNKYGVPEPLVTLASKEYYSKGEAQYSVTELMSPPKIRQLRELHNEDVAQDVSDMLWSMLGSALHVVMERGETPGWIKEERLFLEIDGFKVSGQIDLQEIRPNGVAITDYKFTSAWAVMQDKIEWEQQLNVYSYLVQKVKGMNVVELNICAFIRDFSRHDRRENYPEAPVHMVSIPMWTNEQTEAYIKERMNAHNRAKYELGMGGSLPDCTPTERWMSETTYAVKKEGRKTAVRVFKTIEEANELAEKEKGYVETRLGEPKRCTGNYCGVAEWCEQYKREQHESAT
jgi:hypothetical protein